MRIFWGWSSHCEYLIKLCMGLLTDANSSLSHTYVTGVRRSINIWIMPLVSDARKCTSLWRIESTCLACI